MEQRSQITFYRSYYEAVLDLPKRDQLLVLLAILAYGLDGIEPELSGVQSSVFKLVRPTLDTGRKRAASGKVGGSKQQANRKQPAREKEKEGEKEKEIEKESYSPISPLADPGKDKPKRTAKTIPPTLEEVTAYCKERNKGIDPDAFFDYYTANGWRVGKDKMKDWQAAVRTWENRRKEEPHERAGENPYTELCKGIGYRV